VEMQNRWVNHGGWAL